MTRTLCRLAAAIAVALSVAACGEERSPAAPTKPAPEPTVTLVEIEGTYQLASPGLTTQLRAFATYSDGIQYDVTRDAVWTVFDEKVVRIAPGGMATATGYGETTVLASYGGVVSKFGFGFRVTALAGPRHALTGVVRDASTGAPLGGARASVLFSGVTYFATSNGSGELDLGTAAGPTIVTVRRVGYEDAQATASVDAPTRIEVGLVPTPGASIERSVEGRFGTASFDQWTSRISTRPDGQLDLEVQGLDCADNSTLQISAGSRTGSGDSGRPDFSCYARARFAIGGDGDIGIIVTGRNLTRFRLTYREPR